MNKTGQICVTKEIDCSYQEVHVEEEVQREKPEEEKVGHDPPKLWTPAIQIENQHQNLIMSTSSMRSASFYDNCVLTIDNKDPTWPL